MADPAVSVLLLPDAVGFDPIGSVPAFNAVRGDRPLPPLPVDRLAQFFAAAMDMVASFVSWGIIKLTRSFDEFLVGTARRDEAWIVAGIPLAWFITVPRRLLLWLYGDFGSVGFWQFWQCPLSAF